MEQNGLKTEILTEKEDRLINEEICRLLQFGFNHGEMRKEILQSALILIPANAPSTIFSVRRSYNISKGINRSEKDFEFHHLKLPANQNLAEDIKEDIESHIVSVNSLIEDDYHRKFAPTGVVSLRGLYHLTRLLDRRTLRQLARSSLTTIKVNDIVFGWIRYNLNEVWLIGLRRLADLPKFDNHEHALLKTFASRLYDFRNAWNKEDASRQYLDVLTNREQEAIYHFVGGFKDKDTSARMNISKRTLDAHWQNIFNKIGVSDKILVLDKLGMITNKIPLENEMTINRNPL